MKNERLRDGGAADPSWSALERLCQSQPPSARDVAMQARVLARLERPRRQALRLRPAFAVLCVLFFAGTAGKFEQPRVRLFAAAFGVALFLFAVIRMLLMPAA